MRRLHALSDYQVREAVVKGLDWTPGVRVEHIGVAVTDSAVTLSGEVDSLEEKMAAIRVATDLPGVDAVVDELHVRHGDSVRNDADVAREVQQAIETMPTGPGGGVTAVVRDGRVQLNGTVATADHRDAIGCAVATMPGVRLVDIQITVLAAPTVEQVKARVAQTLSRATDDEAQRLFIEIDGHTVILRGVVHSPYERRAAADAAERVPGVTLVDNQLTVAC